MPQHPVPAPFSPSPTNVASLNNPRTSSPYTPPTTTQNPSTRVKVGKTLLQATMTWMMILTMTLRMMTKKMGKSFSRSFYLPSTNPVLNPPEPRSATPRFTMAVTKQSYAPSSCNVCLTSETTPKLSLQARQKFNMPSLTSPVPRSNTLNQ